MCCHHHHHHHHCHRYCYPNVSTYVRCWRCGNQYWAGAWHVCPSPPPVCHGPYVYQSNINSAVARLAG